MTFHHLPIAYRIASSSALPTLIFRRQKQSLDTAIATLICNVPGEIALLSLTYALLAGNLLHPTTTMTNIGGRTLTLTEYNGRPEDVVETWCGAIRPADLAYRGLVH
jgi:hypothetical protein